MNTHQDQKHEIDLLRRQLAESADAMREAIDALDLAERVQGQLVAALQLAQVALTHSEAKARVYDEPVKRHADALAAVNAALASAGATQ
jgi:flagellar biosynthesis regulator FlaF